MASTVICGLKLLAGHVGVLSWIGVIDNIWVDREYKYAPYPDFPSDTSNLLILRSSKESRSWQVGLSWRDVTLHHGDYTDYWCLLTRRKIAEIFACHKESVRVPQHRRWSARREVSVAGWRRCRCKTKKSTKRDVGQSERRAWLSFFSATYCAHPVYLTGAPRGSFLRRRPRICIGGWAPGLPPSHSSTTR